MIESQWQNQPDPFIEKPTGEACRLTPPPPSGLHGDQQMATLALASARETSLPITSPQPEAVVERSVCRSESAGATAFGQTLFFLFAMAVMLAASRFAMPVIVEEIRYAWHRGELRAKYDASGDGLKNVSLGALSQAYQMVTHQVGPSVVHIEVNRASQEASARIANLLGGGLGGGSSAVADQGSGVVIDADGYIMTNHHVISEGNSILVGLSDGRRIPARVIGTDELTDLALLKVDADRLIPITWADSDRCEVGSPVWAVGSPFGLDRTVTFGILSGKNRVVKASSRYQDFMQSDAAINPGNSGGPLVDAHGHLIGINTAIVGDTFRGVSFSIPSNVVRTVYERLKKHGRFDRGWLGIALDEVSDELFHGEDYRIRGAYITGLAGEDSPAARGGARAGDIILRLNNQPIKDVGHLMRMAGNLAAGTSVVLDIRRGEELVALEIIVGSRPEPLAGR